MDGVGYEGGQDQQADTMSGDGDGDGYGYRGRMPETDPDMPLSTPAGATSELPDAPIGDALGLWLGL